MPIRVQWEPAYAVGQALVDEQHQRLLAQCNRLADLCDRDDDVQAWAPAFDQAFEELKALAREHVDAESALLARRGHADVDGLRDEFEEFAFVADEVATTENFDRLELQRFVAHWCLGHVASAAGLYRDGPA